MTIETWSETRGTKPYRVTLLERPDRGLALYMRWYVAGRPRYELTRVRTVRDARGRVLRRAVEAAQAEADEKIRELKGEARGRKRRAGPLSLREGVDLAFSDRGPYPLDPRRDAWTKEARRRIEEAVRRLGGDDVLWEDVTPGMLRAVWRQIEQDHRGRADTGCNKAEKTLVVFWRVSTWLQGEFQDQRFPAPLKGWRQELRGYFEKQGHDTTPAQPRFSPDEVRRLFAHIPQADPRLAFALMLGAELRGGQVMRTWRSGLDLSPGAGAGHGVARIPFGSRRKKAPTIYLNRTERAAVDAAIGPDGYLSLLEAAFEANEIHDYPLFPGGKLRQGKAPVRAVLRPMHPTSIAAMLHDLEELAGVDQVTGRGWHGLRRAFTDLYPEATADARLLDAVQGWAKGSTMREGTYQEKESDAVATRAAELREQVRPQVGPTTHD